MPVEAKTYEEASARIARGQKAKRKTVLPEPEFSILGIPTSKLQQRGIPKAPIQVPVGTGELEVSPKPEKRRVLPAKKVKPMRVQIPRGGGKVTLKPKEEDRTDELFGRHAGTRQLEKATSELDKLVRQLSGNYKVAAGGEGQAPAHERLAYQPGTAEFIRRKGEEELGRPMTHSEVLEAKDAYEHYAYSRGEVPKTIQEALFTKRTGSYSSEFAAGAEEAAGNFLPTLQASRQAGGPKDAREAIGQTVSAVGDVLSAPIRGIGLGATAATEELGQVVSGAPEGWWTGDEAGVAQQQEIVMGSMAMLGLGRLISRRASGFLNAAPASKFAQAALKIEHEAGKQFGRGIVGGMLQSTGQHYAKGISPQESLARGALDTASGLLHSANVFEDQPGYIRALRGLQALLLGIGGVGVMVKGVSVGKGAIPEMRNKVRGAVSKARQHLSDPKNAQEFADQLGITRDQATQIVKLMETGDFTARAVPPQIQDQIFPIQPKERPGYQWPDEPRYQAPPTGEPHAIPIQEPTSNVLREERPEVGLPEVGQPHPEAIAPGEGAPVKEATETGAARVDEAPALPGLTMLSPESVKVHPRVQYKSGLVDHEAGVTSLLRDVDVYDVDQGGVWTVWESKTGERFVVNGHHRRDLALRAKRFISSTQVAGREVDVPRTVPTRILREADGWTLERARAQGALENIRDQKGSALDAAKVLRELGKTRDELRGLGISLRGNMGRNLEGLMGLDDKAFALVDGGVVPDEVAAGVGASGINPERQMAALKASGSLRTYEEGLTLGRKIAKREVEAEGGGLFDDDAEFAEYVSFVAEESRIQEAVKRALAKDRGALLKMPDELLADERINASERKRMAEEYGASGADAKNRVDFVFDHDSDLSATIQNLAKEVKNGTRTAEEAAKELIPTVKDRIKGDLGRYLQGDREPGTGAAESTRGTARSGEGTLQEVAEPAVGPKPPKPEPSPEPAKVSREEAKPPSPDQHLDDVIADAVGGKSTPESEAAVPVPEGLHAQVRSRLEELEAIRAQQSKKIEGKQAGGSKLTKEDFEYIALKIADAVLSGAEKFGDAVKRLVSEHGLDVDDAARATAEARVVLGVDEAPKEKGDNVGIGGISNSFMEDLGREMPGAEKETVQQWIDSARTRMRDDPEFVNKTLGRIETTTKATLSTEEGAAVALRVADLEARYVDATPDTRVVIDAELDRIAAAVKKSGSEQARAFAVRAFLLASDDSVAGMVRAWKLAHGGEAPNVEIIQKFKDMEAEIKSAKAEIDRLTQELLEARKTAEPGSEETGALAEQVIAARGALRAVKGKVRLSMGVEDVTWSRPFAMIKKVSRNVQLFNPFSAARDVTGNISNVFAGGSKAETILHNTLSNALGVPKTNLIQPGKNAFVIKGWAKRWGREMGDVMKGVGEDASKYGDSGVISKARGALDAPFRDFHERSFAYDLAQSFGKDWQEAFYQILDPELPGPIKGADELFGSGVDARNLHAQMKEWGAFNTYNNTTMASKALVTMHQGALRFIDKAWGTGPIATQVRDAADLTIDMLTRFTRVIVNVGLDTAVHTNPYFAGGKALMDYQLGKANPESAAYYSKRMAQTIRKGAWGLAASTIGAALYDEYHKRGRKKELPESIGPVLTQALTYPEGKTSTGKPMSPRGGTWYELGGNLKQTNGLLYAFISGYSNRMIETSGLTEHQKASLKARNDGLLAILVANPAASNLGGLLDLSDTPDAEDYLDKMLSKMSIPGLFTEVAQLKDRLKTGSLRRKAKGEPWGRVREKLPWLREKLPKGTAKRIPPRKDYMGAEPKTRKKKSSTRRKVLQ